MSLRLHTRYTYLDLYYLYTNCIMSTVAVSTQAIRHEVISIISSLKKINPGKLSEVNDLTELNFDILDVVDIILEVEKAYSIYIPDDVPVYTIDDFVDFIYKQNLNQAC
ncbi:acyl carrier protein [Pontibacter sp. MBLB2868]|uniref:acyl carrier protein n=1 Tax=Pontibacter sp. MBLB2868 TaxID=3451555 RepID=UPI003F74C1DB